MGIVNGIKSYVKNTKDEFERLEAREKAHEEKAYYEKEDECIEQAEKDLTKLTSIVSYIARNKDTKLGKYQNQGYIEKADTAWRIRPCIIEFDYPTKKTFTVEQGMEANFLPKEKINDADGVYFSKDLCILSIKGSNLGSTDVIIGRDGNIYGVSFQSEEQKYDEYDFGSFDVTECAFDSNPSEKVQMLDGVSEHYIKNMSSTLCQGIIGDAYISLGRDGKYKKYDDEKAMAVAGEKFVDSYTKSKDFRVFYEHASDCNKTYYGDTSISYNGYDSAVYLDTHVDEKGNFVPEGIKVSEDEIEY